MLIEAYLFDYKQFKFALNEARQSQDDKDKVVSFHLI